MKANDATEQSYKNGYEDGKRDAAYWNGTIHNDAYMETERAYRNGYAAGYNDEKIKYSLGHLKQCPVCRRDIVECKE